MIALLILSILVLLFVIGYEIMNLTGFVFSIKRDEEHGTRFRVIKAVTRFEDDKLGCVIVEKEYLSISLPQWRGKWYRWSNRSVFKTF